MSVLADIFAAVHLNLETGEFEASAAKAADSAGATMGQRLSGYIKGATKAAVGAGIGLGVAVALTGANQLDEATRKLQADTGMTADEAKVAEHALAGMYENNLQGFAQIGDVMAQVHNDLGLAGDAADAATESFLKFGTATGQDASAAVAQFREILDAWNLTAADATPLMDKLVASHQKFGGVIADEESALRTMAPVLQAANATVDDGIGLLNLFETAGIDASKAPQALAHAVKELKPGQGLNDLIKQISSIEDPTKRAQEAMRIFGVRGGVQLAQAFQPGITSLDDFKISADDAAGATNRASDAVESGFGAQFTLLLHKAGGALAEFGTQFGPLVMLASTVGPSFARAIGSGLGALGALIGPKLIASFESILPQAIASGTATGTAMGEAAAAASIAAELEAGVPETVAAVEAGTGGAAELAGATVGTAMGASAAAAEITAEAAGVTAGQAVVAEEAAPAAATAGTAIGTAMGAAMSAAMIAAVALAPAVAIEESGALSNIKEAFNSVLYTILSGGDTAEGNRRAKAITELENRAFKDGTDAAIPQIITDTEAMRGAVGDALARSGADAAKAAATQAEIAAKAQGTALGHSIIIAADLASPAYKGLGRVAREEFASITDAALTMRDGTSSSLDTIGSHTNKLADDFDKTQRRIRAQVDATVTQLDKDANALIANAFDPIIAKDKLIATNAQIASDKRILASKKATAQEKADALSNLHEQEKTQAELLLTMAETGQTTTKAYKDGLANLKTEISKATGPTKTALQGVLDKLNAINSLDPTITIHLKVPKGGIYVTPDGKTHIKDKDWLIYDTGGIVPGPPGTHYAAVVEAGEGIIPADQMGVKPWASGPGDGGTTNITVALPVSARPDPFEVANQLRRVRDFGLLRRATI